MEGRGLATIYQEFAQHSCPPAKPINKFASQRGHVINWGIYSPDLGKVSLLKNG
jgi:hypothetical protein